MAAQMEIDDPAVQERIDPAFEQQRPPAGEHLAHLERRDAQLSDREVGLADLLSVMEDYEPVIPDAVADYYLSKSGFDCDDVRIKRLLALATQKFIADVARDAVHYSKIRQQAEAAKDRRRNPPKDRKLILTLDDLSASLSEYGINVRKRDYYA